MGSAIKSVGSSLFGTRTDAGVLGTGQFKAKEYKIDKDAVNNAAVGSNAEQAAVRKQQEEFAKALLAQTQGLGPSVVQDQLTAATDKTVAQAAGAAASSRGASPAIAARTALMAQANATQEAANQSAQLKAQEQLSAQSQLGTALANQRSQDINVADSDRAAKLGLEQLGVTNASGANTVNAGAYASASQNRGNLIGGMGTGLAAMSDEASKEEIKPAGTATKDLLEKISVGLKESSKQSEIDSKKTGHEKMGEGIGKGLSSLMSGKKDEAGGSTEFSKEYLAMSDEESKTEIKPSDADLKAFVSALKAHTYKYKDEFKDEPGAGEGEYTSPMAQELEKTELGKSMVKENEDGTKVVDYGKGFGTMLASQAALNDRISELEKALKHKMKKGDA